jgi:energy-coupling factor transporter ATP-binding protein EcfA2
MKKIALIGAAGSGKSDFAWALHSKLDSDEYESCVVLDQYVEEFSGDTGLAVAQFATYVVNMQIAMERLRCELEVSTRYDENQPLEHLIICGTLIDTTIYHAINSLALVSDGNQFDERALALDMRANVTAQWLGMMKRDTWNYDHVFYLPLAKKDEEYSLAQIFDEQVEEACDAFEVKYTRLDQKTLNQKVKAALKEINEVVVS